jgi:O-antigen/teichoic acid export membrane protein
MASKTVISIVHAVTSAEQPKVKDILSRGFVNQLGNLAHMLSNRFNYYVLAASGLSILGVYGSGTSLIESVWTVSAALSPLVLSRVANSANASAESGTSLRLATYSLLLSTLLVIIILMVPAEIFTMILGEDFSQVKVVMLYLAPGVLALSFSSVISHYFSGRGMQRVLLIANAAGLGVTLLLSKVMISKLGITGACITASLAYAMQCTVLVIVFFKERNKF